MIANVFNTPRLCAISGNIKPLGQLKATPRETQLFASNKAEREKIVLSEEHNGISIPKLDDYDARRKMRKARI